MVQVAKLAADDMCPMFVPLPQELEALLATGDYTPKNGRGLSQYSPFVPTTAPLSPYQSNDSTASPPLTPPAGLRPPPGLALPMPVPDMKVSDLYGAADDTPTTAALSAGGTPPTSRRGSNKMTPQTSKDSGSSTPEAPLAVQDASSWNPKLAGTQSQEMSRWWTRSLVLCPLTGFPISLLPYPPFKLRVDPKKPRPHTLVDGKFLAMQIIVDDKFVACDRTLQASDIAALDEYIHRCKLGPFRPGQARSFSKEAQLAESSERRSQAAEDLKRLVAAASSELSKLRRIQENRLRQMTNKGQALPQGVAEPEGSQRRRNRTF
mmetsp:Transcript_11242/g.25791  ORF Transcript_11242/g.25791 Transcript_11242/m.25791 type:complete len:321 (+) Transcript_11242:124-1086(+)